MKKSINPSDIVAVIDTREKLKLDLSPLRVVAGTLDTGDYSVQGLEHLVAIERKSIPDLVACVGRERPRFDRECQRLLSYPTRAIVVEGSWRDLEIGPGLPGGWRGQTSAAAVQGSVLGWVALGIPVLMAHDAQTAGRMVARLLYITARRRWLELYPYAEIQAARERKASHTASTMPAESTCHPS